MKVKLLQPMMIAGKPKEPGDEVSIPDHDANYLIARGKAEKVKPQAKAKAKGKKETSASSAASKRETAEG